MLHTWFTRLFQPKHSSFRAKRSRQPRPAGCSLRLELLEDRLAPANVWTATGILNNARYQDTATLLQNGDVLVAGGQNGGTLSSAELYDPTTGAWSTTGNLNTPRYNATATLLQNGDVLVAGGQNGSGVLASAELYDPNAGTWSYTTGSLNTARVDNTVTLLQNGDVLVAGGYDTNFNPLASAELYDPNAGTWSYTTGSLNTARVYATATLLNNGQVLVAAGYNNGYLASAETYDPNSETWSYTIGSMNNPRDEQTATLFNNGKVLVAGGFGNSGPLFTAELFDPMTSTWSAAPNMINTHGNALATLLQNGEVLVAGGDINGPTANAELYDPVANRWSNTASLNTARDGTATLTLLNNGQVLVAGGYNFGFLSSAELYSTTPTISSPFTATFTYGVYSAWTIEALTDAPVPATTTITAIGLPGWASFNPANGVVSGTPTAATAKPISITVTASNGVAPDAVNIVQLTVNPAPLFISADAKFKFYGQANPTLTASYSGFVNGDTASNLTGTLSLNTTATTGSGAGAYPITVSGVSSSNYSITFLNGTLFIIPAPLTVSADSKFKVYGQANPSFTASYSGFVNGDTASNLTGTLSLGTTATTSSGAGTYPITASGVSSSNYNITFLSGTLFVLPAPLTVMADDQTKISGQANPTFTASYNGFVNGDTSASLGSALSFNTPATTSSGAGTYPITPSGLTSPNYSISFVNGRLNVVVGTAQTITFKQPTSPVTFGVAPITLSATSSSKLPVTFSVKSGPGTISGNKLTVTGAGSIVIAADQAGNSTFAPATEVQHTLVVNKATLTVAANNASWTAGKAGQSLAGFTISGFVNGDTEALLFGAEAAVVSCPTVNASNPKKNTYVILITRGTLVTPANYNLTFKTGKLTVQ